MTLGKLSYIAESGGAVPVIYDQSRVFSMEAATSGPTPISGGELTIQVSVQAVFGIE